ncbi:hypothetical protein V502_02942 [Pseudogymnoascus sp. VKM F-4520 (FW-2644)]|nr:hypothetical protein V502_02942 [Pseudogymnoascus sp. VKM F-4520 (FW-2644)]
MVNVPGRSKGCLTCRRRKVKCDQSFPECLQCLEMRLPCPGARTGTFFVHTLPAPPPHWHTTQQTSVDPGSRLVSASTAVERPDTPLHFSLFSSIQPSRADFFDCLFLTHFIESFGNLKASDSAVPSTIWLNELPGLLTSPLPSLEKYSIRAGSMLFYGTQTHDVSIQAEARILYARALRGLRYLLLQGACVGDSAASFTEGAICTAVMLGHFESVDGTSLGAWFQHVDGASMMLEAGGPERCRLGFMHQLFRHLRLLTLVATMARNKSHPFGSQQWITIPFENHPKTFFDLLIDVLFSLPRCLTVAKNVMNSSGEEADILVAELDTLIQSSVSQIDLLWSQGLSRFSSGKDSTYRCLDFADGAAETLPWGPNPFQNIVYNDLPTAALSALYDAANVVLWSLLFFVSPSGDVYEGLIQLHAQSIISASEFVSVNSCPSSVHGSLMMLFPLKIVSLWSSSLQQRNRAVKIIQALGSNGGFDEVMPNGREVPKREDEEENEDEMKDSALQRLENADERTKAIPKEEYVTWSKYRQASFNRKRFVGWAGFGTITNPKPNDDIVDIIGFLTFEIVQTLTEEALRIKEREDLIKEKTWEEMGMKRTELGLFDQSEGKVPLQPRHIQEKFRRLQDAVEAGELSCAVDDEGVLTRRAVLRRCRSLSLPELKKDNGIIPMSDRNGWSHSIFAAKRRYPIARSAPVRTSASTDAPSTHMHAPASLAQPPYLPSSPWNT